MRRVAFFALLLVTAGAHAQETPVPLPPASPADSAQSPLAPADSALAPPPPGAPADSALASPPPLAAADSASAADSAAVRAFHPHPALESLTHFRVDWSVNYEPIPFRDPNEPSEPAGAATMGPLLRLRPAIRTREISQTLGAESFAIGSGSSSSSGLLLDGRSISIPGTSGPHSEEIVLSEISSLGILRGGAAALYGPEAASGAVLASQRFPHHEELLARASGEEGVDEYQRASFQASRRIGRHASFFATAESRRIEGFFPGTKETDRHFAFRVRGDVFSSWQGEVGGRRFEGDERSGGFDQGDVIPMRTRRSEAVLKLFRPYDESRGALLETSFVRQKIENVDPASIRTREVTAPSLQFTTDLPKWRKLETALRAEATHWRIEDEGEAEVDRFWRGGAAIRWTGVFAKGLRVTETARIDAEESRNKALQGRFEAAFERGAFRVLGVASRNERIPDREASNNDTNEIHHTILAALQWKVRRAAFTLEGEASRVDDFRPEPTFEEVRRRDAPLGPPIGTGEFRRGTFALSTEALNFPGAAIIGELHFLTSFTVQTAEIEETGARIPGWATRTWTGEGWLERRFFRDELLLRLRGRLTHLADRVDLEGDDVVDAWVTDVLLEGEIGDAIFHARFHDMLERADEIEPGYRFPGFSRTYGISWRFWG